MMCLLHPRIFSLHLSLHQLFASFALVSP
ncbi:hypothetical protein E2C01_062489 [Portunus trituberculatus]|uniref:Uncharacterized protein n=1 Tax=Portunus trituberculatus TaxID=210409 RepID=A0A5B7H6K2_PORTR|nr:hypothetical protein [Portunus trituberculatus]